MMSVCQRVRMCGMRWRGGEKADCGGVMCGTMLCMLLVKKTTATIIITITPGLQATF